MVGKTNVTGDRLRAVIAVSYPEGSACTCSNGSKTITAPDTSGNVIFDVSPGKWTVRAEDTTAGKSKESEVTVAADGESHEVTLTYELILFNAGSYAEETGGWTGISGNVLKSSTSCNDMDGVYQWTCQTNNPVNLANYKTLYIIVSSVAQSYYYTCYFGVGTSKTSHASRVEIGSAKTYSIDVSKLNAPYYLSLYHGGAASQNGATNGNTTVKISKVWLE